MLLIGAGLICAASPRSSASIRASTRGMLVDGRVGEGLAGSGAGPRAAFYAQALDRLRALPGVGAASAINHLPIDGDQWGRGFISAGRTISGPTNVRGPSTAS